MSAWIDGVMYGWNWTFDDILDLELWIAIEQSLKKNKRLKSFQAKELADLIRARFFLDATREDIHKILDCDNNTVQALWKEFSRKSPLKKNHLV